MVEVLYKTGNTQCERANRMVNAWCDQTGCSKSVARMLYERIVHGARVIIRVIRTLWKRVARSKNLAMT